uniref:Reverse transcriptase Ty1/copia-type domain-containing protein n=1 Tax=Solanum lycopersicum TaxID=4081 RepID=A0A3Q7G4Z0_SOLLC
MSKRHYRSLTGQHNDRGDACIENQWHLALLVPMMVYSSSKHAFDHLYRTNMLCARSLQTPISQNITSSHLLILMLMQPNFETFTPPKTSHDLKSLYQLKKNTTENHWLGVKLILRYIAGTSPLGLRITMKSSLHLVGFWTQIGLVSSYKAFYNQFMPLPKRKLCLFGINEATYTSQIKCKDRILIIRFSCYRNHVDYIYFEGYKHVLTLPDSSLHK